MREYSCTINGKDCISGTIIIIRNNGEKSKEAYFQWYDPEKDRYCVLIDGKQNSLPKNHFFKILVSVTDRFDVTKVKMEDILPKKWSLEAELSIDGMFLAWFWYIFIMVIGTIFNDRALIWIGASIWFFSYRSEKLRKAGYKK